MSLDNSIKPIEIFENKKKLFKCPQEDHPDQILPIHPFRMLISGPSQSGKTTFLLNLINNVNFYKDFFVQIILVSPNIHSEQFEQVLKEMKDIIIPFDEFQEDQLTNIYDSQMEMILKDGFENSGPLLWIFDDLVDNKSFLHSRFLEMLVVRGRHSNSSSIFTSQYYNGYPLKLRKNATNIILFPSSNKEEMKAIARELIHKKLTEEEFHQLFLFATNEPFSFLHVNLQSKNIDNIYRCKFQKILNINKK